MFYMNGVPWAEKTAFWLGICEFLDYLNLLKLAESVDMPAIRAFAFPANFVEAEEKPPALPYSFSFWILGVWNLLLSDMLVVVWYPPEGAGMKLCS